MPGGGALLRPLLLLERARPELCRLRRLTGAHMSTPAKNSSPANREEARATPKKQTTPKRLPATPKQPSIDVASLLHKADRIMVRFGKMFALANNYKEKTVTKYVRLRFAGPVLHGRPPLWLKSKEYSEKSINVFFFCSFFCVN